MSARVAPTAPGSGGLPPCVAGEDADSAAIIAAVAARAAAAGAAGGATGLRYPYPRGPTSGGEHCFSDVTETFPVRGPAYLADKVKVDAPPAAFDLMAVEAFRCADKIGNVAARRDSWLRAARAVGDKRYYLVVLYVTPAAPHIHFVFYYAVQPSRVLAAPHLDALWRRFTAHGPDADAFRNERWKVIPRIAEGPWAVSYAVGTKPALLAQKLTHTWVLCDGTADAPPRPSSPPALGGVESVGTQDASCGSSAALPGMGYRSRGGSFVAPTGPGPYLEADCDVASSSMAFMLVSLLQSSARYLVIDLAFTIEPREEDCLPEVLLGTMRLSRIDVAKPAMVDADAGDWVLGMKGASYGADADAAGEAAAEAAADAAGGDKDKDPQ